MKVESTTFMVNLFNSIKDARNLSDSTVTLYFKYLCILNGKKGFNNLAFLKKTEEVNKIIAEYSPNTGKTIYSAIVSVLSLYKNNKTYKATYEYYHTKMMGCAKIYKENTTNEKNDKQKANWVNWDDVLKIRHELNNKVVQLEDKTSLTTSEYNTLLEWVILSLYVCFPPRRNADYLYMYITKNQNPTDTDKNYLVLGKKPMFIFNKFKTVKKEGSKSFEVPPELMLAIETLMKYHPLMTKWNGEPVKLIVDSKGKELTAINTITRILNNIFGKKAGSSMLRHSYLSSKYGDELKERQDDSSKMSHSIQTAEREYIKID